MGKLGEILLPWGYSLPDYERYGIRYPLRRYFSSHGHALVTGPSGSGKSFALLWMLGKLLQACPDIRLTFCDFKNSDEFRFLKSYKGYYAGDHCLQGFRDFYQEFTQARQEGESKVRHLLICDEYQAMVNYFQSKDKREKTKEASEILSIAAEVLMLGRGLQHFIWIVTQRCAAELFSQGTRDNFQVILAIGNQSREQKHILFSSDDLPPNRIYHPGEGLLLSDGYPVMETKFPLISDLEDSKVHILNELRPPDGT